MRSFGITFHYFLLMSITLTQSVESPYFCRFILHTRILWLDPHGKIRIDNKINTLELIVWMRETLFTGVTRRLRCGVM